MKLTKKTPRHLYWQSLWLRLQPTNSMKPILNEIRHLALLNHINYKGIGFVLSKIWIFEVYLRLLSLYLTKVACTGHNSPYTTSNWVQPILLEILHIEQHPIKILESNLVPVAPNNLLKLPHILTGLEQVNLG